MSTQINEAIVYLPEKNLDPNTYQLVSKISKSELFENVRIMPDCHSSSYLLCWND